MAFTTQMEAMFQFIQLYYQEQMTADHIGVKINQLTVEDLQSQGPFNENIIAKMAAIYRFYKIESKYHWVTEKLLLRCQAFNHLALIEELFFYPNENGVQLFEDMLEWSQSWDINVVLPIVRSYLTFAKKYFDNPLMAGTYFKALTLNKKTCLMILSHESDEMTQLYLNHVNDALEIGLRHPITHNQAWLLFYEMDPCHKRLYDNIIHFGSAKSLSYFFTLFHIFSEKALLTEEMQIQILTECAVVGFTPLHEAVMTNDFEKIKQCCAQLEKYGPVVMRHALLKPNTRGFTVMQQAINNGNNKYQSDHTASPEIAGHFLEQFLCSPYFTLNEIAFLLTTLKCDSSKLHANTINRKIAGLQRDIVRALPNQQGTPVYEPVPELYSTSQGFLMPQDVYSGNRNTYFYDPHHQSKRVTTTSTTRTEYYEQANLILETGQEYRLFP